MLTDLILYTAFFAGGWFARGHFGTYAAMKAWVQTKWNGSTDKQP